MLFDNTMKWVDSFVPMDTERRPGKHSRKLVLKAKHGNTRPEEAYERVLWGDLKVMFEPDVESEVWRNLQGYNVTVWKLFSSINKKLQTDQWNEMCYQLLKLMTKQRKNPRSV
ncbi:hypothetical protein Tco_0827470 [Tanacetum coccineum]